MCLFNKAQNRSFLVMQRCWKFTRNCPVLTLKITKYYLSIYHHKSVSHLFFQIIAVVISFEKRVIIDVK